MCALLTFYQCCFCYRNYKPRYVDKVTHFSPGRHGSSPIISDSKKKVPSSSFSQ